MPWDCRLTQNALTEKKAGMRPRTPRKGEPQIYNLHVPSLCMGNLGGVERQGVVPPAQLDVRVALPDHVPVHQIPALDDLQDEQIQQHICITRKAHMTSNSRDIHLLNECLPLQHTCSPYIVMEKSHSDKIKFIKLINLWVYSDYAINCIQMHCITIC